LEPIRHDMPTAERENLFTQVAELGAVERVSSAAAAVAQPAQHNCRAAR